MDRMNQGVFRNVTGEHVQSALLFPVKNCAPNPQLPPIRNLTLRWPLLYVKYRIYLV